MRIFDETKTHELSFEAIDNEKGYLKADRKLVMHHEAVEAKEAVYSDRIEKLPNGSEQTWKDLITPAVEAKEAWDEFEDILVYIPYTRAELAKRRIAELKGMLFETDYLAIKYVEGAMTAEEYASVKEQRQSWRNEINVLETKLSEV